MGASTGGSVARVEINDGFRAWYAACPCCLSESQPDVKAAIDVEGLEHAILLRRTGDGMPFASRVREELM